MKTRIILFLLSFLVITNVCTAQKIDFEKLLKISDSLVVSAANIEFLNTLTHEYDTTPQNFYIGSKQEYMDVYRIWYEPIQTNITSLHVKSTNGISSLGFLIWFNTQYELIHPQREIRSIKESNQALTRYQNSVFISESIAEEVAAGHFSKGMKDTWSAPRFIYDLEADKFFLVFKKFKGLKNVIVEEVYIDAESGLFEKVKTNTNYRRRFVDAIVHYRSI